MWAREEQGVGKGAVDSVFDPVSPSVFASVFASVPVPVPVPVHVPVACLALATGSAVVKGAGTAPFPRRGSGALFGGEASWSRLHKLRWRLKEP